MLRPRSSRARLSTLSPALAKPGKSYLVGPDFSARSEPRLLLEDPARRAFEGVTDTEVIRGYFGGDVLSSYAPLELPGLDWVIVAERSLSEAEASIDDLQRSLLIATGIIVLALTGVAVVLSSALVRPTNRLIAWAKRVREGDVSAELGVRSDDEFGQLASSFDEMLEGLRQQTSTIERQNQENEALLLTMTPASIAHRLRAGEEQIADEYPNVTVIATNLVGFTKLTTRATAHTAAAILNDLVGAFDDAADRIGIEKIKTVSGQLHRSVQNERAKARPTTAGRRVRHRSAGHRREILPRPRSTARAGGRYQQRRSGSRSDRAHTSRF